MRLLWSDEAWEDYLYWQQTDRKVLQAINDLIRDIRRDPFKGLGKPEPLKHDLSRLVVAAHHAGTSPGLPGVRTKRGVAGDHPVPISYVDGCRIDRTRATPYIAVSWHCATS